MPKSTLSTRFQGIAAALSKSVQSWEKTGRKIDALAWDEKTGQMHTIPDGLKGFCSAMSAPDEADLKAQLNRWIAATNPSDPNYETAKRSLNALRIVTIENFARVTTMWREMFFETIDLAMDERPMYKHTYRHEVAVFATSTDGGIKRYKAVKPQNEVYPELYERVVGPVRYKIRDINMGMIASQAEATFELGRDKAEVDDLDHFNALMTCFGSFTTTGGKLDRTFISGRNIRAGVLPTTNSLTTPSQGASTKFKWETVAQAIDYQTRFGRVLGGTELVFTGAIILPADEVVGILDQFNPTNGASNTSNDAAIRDFWTIPLGGRNWTLIPDQLLAPGYAIFPTNRKVGHSWGKPDFERELVTPESAAEQWRQNLQDRELYFNRAITIPGPWKPHVVRVQYHT